MRVCAMPRQVSVLSKRGSGPGAQNRSSWNYLEQCFSPLKARKWAGGDWQRASKILTRCFSPLKARKWAGGIAACQQTYQISFSPLKARKWAGGSWSPKTQLESVVSVLSRRGSGPGVESNHFELDDMRFSPRFERKWAGGQLCFHNDRHPFMFQSSRSEEVGCGGAQGRAQGDLGGFSPLEARKWAAGGKKWGSFRRTLRFSPLEARKWAAGS